MADTKDNRKETKISDYVDVVLVEGEKNGRKWSALRIVFDEDYSKMIFNEGADLKLQKVLIKQEQ